jgi:hypothetical protein
MRAAERLAADRNEVLRQVHEIIEHEFKNAHAMLDVVPTQMRRWDRLDMVTDVVSKKVLHWLEEHPALCQAAVELIVAPLVEERDSERARGKGLQKAVARERQGTASPHTTPPK